MIDNVVMVSAGDLPGCPLLSPEIHRLSYRQSPPGETFVIGVKMASYRCIASRIDGGLNERQSSLRRCSANVVLGLSCTGLDV